MNEGPKVLDLPVAHIPQVQGDYIPPPARDEREIARRQARPDGTLVLEAQRDGTRIAACTLDMLYRKDRESFQYFARAIGGVCLNTAWYSYANLQPDEQRKENHVTRRRLELPKHVTIDEDNNLVYERMSGNEQRIQNEFAHATHLGGELIAAHVRGLERGVSTKRMRYGHAIGNVGLRLAATHLIGARDTPYNIQLAVRNAGLEAIKDSRTLHDGVYPTLAQLPDLDSQLSVQLRRTAPTAVHDELIRQTATVHDIRRERNEAQS